MKTTFPVPDLSLVVCQNYSIDCLPKVRWRGMAKLFDKRKHGVYGILWGAGSECRLKYPDKVLLTL